MPALNDTKRYALITGASAGIGKEFALQLAQQGWSLILTARRQDTLETLRSELSKAHQVDVHVIAGDLGDPNEPQRIYDYCQQQQLNVAMLINNAGFGVPGDFDASDWNTHSNMLQVMLTAVVHLSHLFYADMKAAEYGRIIQVASLAGFAPPTAGHTLYAATKSFLIKFSQSLHMEAEESGVHVTALCPGFTYTEFHDVNGTRDMVSKLPKGMWMSAEEVVRQGLEAVEKNKEVKINGRKNNVIAFLSQAIPDRWMRFLMRKKIQQFRKR
ncbi:SDR family NAD(P)-dependent oxidoreductase [Marinicella sp. W31]|uniref:SDR family NAD(P)-dependent oxidoreductase n=1 Tax=Marinicella sp. W31 TaxID=3023713 RepID=UPI00375806EA